MTQPRMIGDRYELGELIGYGGMAEVHRGRDARLNREVAIKVLRADLARDPAFLNRFRREAHSAAGLNHPSIVSVYDTGETLMPDGTAQPFIVMEFVAGRTLRDIVRTEGSLPPRRAMEITADIASALDFSHRNGIIHRDIKPANVMITPQGAVKVMDFGIARAVADNSSTVTQTANVIGTAQYLSPEQARGETVDARSDVYSLGCLLYELVTGVPPFQGDSPVAVAYQHVRENPVMPSARKPGTPRVLDSIVMKSLAKNQLNRYQSAGDMRSDIQRALANQPVTAEAVMTDAERTQFISRTPPSPLPPRPAPYEPPPEDNSRRTGLIWAAIVLALLLVVGIGAVVLLKAGDSGNDKKTVPDNLQGLTEAQARTLLQNAGFVYARGSDTSGPCVNTGVKPATGRVCSWSPGPGRSEPAKTTVTVLFYKPAAPKTYQVPDLVGQSKDKALQLITAAHLDPGDVEARSRNQLDMNGDAVPNEVLEQNPPAFTEVKKGQKIVILVATGKLALPDVKGKTFEDAQRLIAQAGFTSQIQTKMTQTADQKKDGTVADEQPFADGKLAYKPGTQVTLTIYQYVKPPPTCTSTTVTPPSGATTTPPGASTSPVTSPATSTGSSSSGLPPC